MSSPIVHIQDDHCLCDNTSIINLKTMQVTHQVRESVTRFCTYQGTLYTSSSVYNEETHEAYSFVSKIINVSVVHTTMYVVTDISVYCYGRGMRPEADKHLAVPHKIVGATPMRILLLACEAGIVYTWLQAYKQLESPHADIMI